MSKKKDIKINRLLDEDELKDSYLDSMIFKYDLIRFSEQAKFPHNMSLNYSTLFNAVLKKPHIGQNYIFEVEDFKSDIVDYVKKNNKELKLILTAIIVFKRNLLKSNLDVYMTLLKLVNKDQESNKEDLVLQSVYEKHMAMPVNSLYKLAKI